MNSKSSEAWQQVEELIYLLGATENAKSRNQKSRKPEGNISNEKLRCYQFNNGKEVGLQKNRNKFALYADTKIDSPSIKFKALEPSKKKGG